MSNFIDDRRVSYFNITAEIMDGMLVIKGETDLAIAKKAIIQKLDSSGIKYTDSIELLPSARVSASPFALINLSAANLRKSPGHSSELVSQALMGYAVKILKKDRNWFLIKCPDKYIGWVEEDEITPISADALETYRKADKIIFTGLSGSVFNKNSNASEPVADLVAGNIMVVTGESDGFFEVRLPDGRMGFAEKNSSMKFGVFIREKKPEAGSLVETARSMLGIPYLWGGTCVKGMDCSGFTKTIYSMNGLDLPRDADQQAAVGETVDDSRKFDLLEPGDLLFFGRREPCDTEPDITHVGMWIGQMRYIHASGRVKINSMDSASADFSRYNYNRYIKSTRVAGKVSRSDILDPDLILF
ncbi:MAG TPA: C40 family peptidase [Cyclobacteriaceae bacterium]|nr:C40 family peptidase [Cyclobacteriaceae bacterium]